MPYRVRTVDVFTRRQLAGNQLAVVLDADDLAAGSMQAIAKEMNLAETTFVMTTKHPDCVHRIRIFTPSTELPFAGHPTIGTAWVLLAEGRLAEGERSFSLEEGVGPVGVRVEQRPEGELLWMTHPPVTFGDLIQDRGRVAAALGVGEDDLMPDVPVQIASTGVPFVYVAMRDVGAVDAAVSSAERLTGALGDREAPPFFVFTSTGGDRLYSRMFAPHAFQIHEDPATGAASGPLGAFAVKYGIVPRAALVSIVSQQGTKMGRQSFVHIQLEYSNSAHVPSRIEVGGGVVPVLTAELTLQ
jgi:trans-2,3-dihydro-3-hydroxyanthranilate isomerase